MSNARSYPNDLAAARVEIARLNEIIEELKETIAWHESGGGERARLDAPMHSDSEFERLSQEAFELTRMESQILAIIYQCPEKITVEALAERRAAQAGQETKFKATTVKIYHLRKKLAACGVEIKTVQRRYYCLPDRSRAIIESILGNARANEQRRMQKIEQLTGLAAA